MRVESAIPIRAKKNSLAPSDAILATNLLKKS